MPAALSHWFHAHYYIAILVATVIEGLGFPLPAEALFVAAGMVVHRGEASLGTIVLLAALGNLAGASIGFGIAYVGGKRLMDRVARMLRLKPEALFEVDHFFRRYGAATVFLSRFIGFIRAATIYSSGAAHMSPWRFAVYTFSAALLWNAGWAFLAYQFGAALPHLLHRLASSRMLWLAVLVLFVCGGIAVLLIRRRRDAADS
ncbi:MAG TPA: DedA family protein [Symbiobacteriaceae bacterium]|nr:DedA family protein [Symbiobacteriaceae bacterium]